MSIVELHQVHKYYQNVAALKGIDLTLNAGEVLGLFGHNGAGKTTVIKLILGLISANQGDIRVLGISPCANNACYQRKHIGFLQENVRFYEQLTGFEVLRYFCRLKGFPKAPVSQQLEQVGLASVANLKVKTYSKGMRQRLGLAQAILGNPKLLLLDEPTVGLDPIATQSFYQSLQNLKEQGCAVILCSHVLPGIEKYIDRALILGQGKSLAEGNLEKLRRQASLPVRFFLWGNNIQCSNIKNVVVHQQSGGLELEVPVEQAMDCLRQLCTWSGVEHLDMQLPSLEDIYSYFIQQSAEANSCSEWIKNDSINDHC